MKILNAIILTGLATVMLNGAEAGVLKGNMQKLNENMTKIENAFNTGDMNGAAAIAKDLDTFNKSLFDNSDKVREMLPTGKERYANIAMSQSRKLDKALVALTEDIQAKSYDKAQKDFMNAKNACMNCHAIVRDWGNK